MNDPDTGLVYMQARYYDPEVGSFLSLDPVGPTPGDLFAFNRYDYAGNNPVKNIDPDGRAFGFDDAAGILIGGAIGLVVETGKDVFVSQRLPTKGEAFGSIVSGAILGEGTVNAPETAGASAAIVWGGAAGAAGNFVQQTVDVHDGTQKELSVKSFAVSTIFGAIAGGVVSKLLPEASIPGRRQEEIISMQFVRGCLLRRRMELHRVLLPKRQPKWHWDLRHRKHIGP